MRQQSGVCVAINDAWEKEWEQGEVANKICVYTKGEVFDFLLEEGWLYHLIRGRKRIRIQYAAFDKDFEIIKV